MSLVLAFDTATDRIALALGNRSDDEVDVVLERDFEAPRASLARLLPEIQEALARARLSTHDIDEIVVGVGPGSFTGVRIGVATAKGLAHGMGVPLYGVSTLDAVAWRHADHEGVLGVVGDAMRGEVYPAVFDVADGHVSRREADCVAKPEVVAAEWSGSVDGPGLITGDGLKRYEPLFAESLGMKVPFASRHTWPPSGRSLLAAYEDERRRGDIASGDPGALVPIYTRLSDAEESEIERGATP